MSSVDERAETESARLDVVLVRRGLARSRDHAGELIAAGVVQVDHRIAVKRSMRVAPSALIRADAGAAPAALPPTYVSRGAGKLVGALDAFEPLGLVVRARRWLDVGASTGGFTQVLLERGARSVLAVDVGTDQLAPVLRHDSRVLVLEQTDIRAVPATENVDAAVIDVSFISLLHVLPAVHALVRADVVALVKPQFEVGRREVRGTGVVRSAALRADAVRRVVDCAVRLGLGTVATTASPLPGPAGNHEFFLWLRARDGGEPRTLTDREIADLVAVGP